MNRILSAWVSIGTSRNIGLRLLRSLLYVSFALMTYQCITMRSDWEQQAIVGCLTLVIVLVLYKFSQAYVSTVMLIVASLLTTARYAVWRVSQVYEAIRDPGSDLSRIEVFFTLMLLSAEMYAFTILLLGFIQTIYPLRRPPVHLPDDIDEWPEVDVLIPTYNEPLSVVRSTVLASINIDYPADKLHVYLLDDGRRNEFRTFCEQIGVGYITRTDNLHAKAGNINRALTGMSSPFVAVFDCDHVPTSSFLQVTVGWFLKDRKLAMLQTPHHFYSRDPFERNLGNYGLVPNEEELFYGLLQDGNDLWNATFFCGSCAVLRRTALDQIGGIAVETVTEDAHTSLRMQMKGWNTAYINIPQAAGLATESLSAHVGQRIRWARGMVQILRINNPLFAPGLKLAQRLCYFNAMVHFLYALPRLIFLTAPLVYMVLGQRNIPGLWITIAVYAVPHLVVSNVTNARLQGRYRHSFWNEVYETVLAPYILGPTLLALINPKLGKFNVTAKGGIVEKRYFDTLISRPYRYLLLLNYIGLAIAPWRYFVLDADHRGAVLMNVFWIFFNCVVLGTANAVAVEERQLRDSIRLNLTMKLRVRDAKGVAIEGMSSTLSLAGGSVTLERSASLKHGDAIEILYLRKEEEVVVLPARVVACGGMALRFQYLPLSLQDEELLTLVLYSSPDTWLQRKECPVDRPLTSLASIMRLSLRGIRYSLKGYGPTRVGNPAAAAAAILLACMILLPLSSYAATQTEEGPNHVFQRKVTMSDMGEKGDVMLRGADVYANELLVLSESEVAQSGTLHLQYSFSPELTPGRTLLTVSFNETTLANLTMPEDASSNDTPMVADIPIPGELLATRNTLRIHLQAHYKAECEDPGDPRLWARIGSASNFDIRGILLPIAVDLSTLPAPFYEADRSVASSTIAVAFASIPSTLLLQAAGALSSWFGVAANSHKLVFPVTIGHIPAGNTVVIARNDSPILDALTERSSGPHIAMKVNPTDGISRVLIVTGDDDGQVLAAARTLASGMSFTGESSPVDTGKMLAAPAPVEAPRWQRTVRNSSLWSYSQTGELQSDGSRPIASYVRLPPDLFWDDEQIVRMHLDYTSNNASSRPGFMRVTANEQQVGYFPLATRGGKDAIQSMEVSLPVAYLRPFANTLLFEFFFQPERHDFCRTLPPSNSTGTLLKSSGLDLHSVSRWASLPNLQLFANAGFPFTRAADLSQTTVVLPEQPNEREIGTMLNLLGYFGAQTGYPALRVEVGGIDSYGKDRDLLVIGSEQDIVTTSRVDDDLALSFQGAVFVRRTRTTLGWMQRLWERLSHLNKSSFSDLADTEQDRNLDRSLETPPSSVIESIESPTAANRSIVIIVLGNGQDELFPSFADVSSSDQIHGDVSLQHGSNFDSYTLSTSSYHVGNISILARCRAWMHQEPWVGVLLPFIIGMLFAPWLMTNLERRAEQRLLGDEA